MYKITVNDDFSSAHFLREYRGKCERLHGHNWKVSVSILSEKLNSKGMIIDFKILKTKLYEVLKNLDHKCLNDISYFKRHNPTSENIAKYIHDQIKKKLKAQNFNAINISVWETDRCCASVIEG